MLMRTRDRLKIAFGLLAVVLVAKWCLFSSRQATVQLSPTQFCTIRSPGIFHSSAEKGVPLVYYENGAPVGEVRFAYGPETGPLGIFPGTDSQTIICVYGTDLTVGVFAIELAKRTEHAVPPPPEMFKSGIVKSTNFGLRRCTKSEVDQLMQLIRSANDSSLREMTYPGLFFDLHDDKDSLLKAIEYGSGLYHKFPPSVNFIPRSCTGTDALSLISPTRGGYLFLVRF